MGGKALKQCNIRRMTAERFEEVRDFVMSQLEADFPGYRLEVYKAYRAKQDFGNLSLLMDAGSAAPKMNGYLSRTFKPLQIVSNGDMHSFEVKGHQVDLMLVASEQFQMVADYHAYNGLGWLLGELAHAMGMKLSPAGLTYSVQTGTWKLADISLASTWPFCLTALGYNPQRWEKGFDGLESIFEFVASSPNYSSDIFADHGYKDIPEGERLTMRQSMAKWVDENPVKVSPFNVGKEAWQAFVLEKFPFVQQKVQEIEKQHQDHLVAREKFNGNLVTELTGRTQRELGQFLTRFQESLGGKDGQTTWVLGASADAIKQKILEVHATV